MHRIGQHVFGPMLGRRNLANGTALIHRFVSRQHLLGYFEAVEMLHAVHLPGQHMGNVGVVTGAAPFSRDENNGVAPLPGKAHAGQKRAPRNHHFFLKRVQKLSWPVEIAQKEMGQAKGHLCSYFDFCRLKFLGQRILFELGQLI